jgi:type IV secretory pathway TrbF-like protein
METHTESPGLLKATGCAEQLQRLEDAAAADVERIKLVYREIERRDGAANWHAALWFRFACLLAVVLIVASSAIVYFAMQASKCKRLSRVQITGTADGAVGPQRLLDPARKQSGDGYLAQWVTKRRWRGDEEGFKRTRNDWAWLYRHSCGYGSKLLAHDEVTEQPLKPSKVRASIEIKSITRTATPESYQVVWHEVTVDKLASTLKEQDYIGTFTVGRVRPKNLSEAIDNRLGMCINGYDLAPRVGS